MRSSKVRGVLGFVCGAGALALCLVAGFRVVNAAEVTLVTREVSLGKIHPGVLPSGLAISPDSKHVAYGAGRGDKLLVVVDGVEGKEYDGIVARSPVFSPDSKRVAYGAQRGGKQLVVVDGVEGKEYDAFLKGSRLVFDGPSQFHTLALSGNEFSRVEVEIVMPAAEPSGAPRPHL
jgi:hypothetical protein